MRPTPCSATSTRACAPDLLFWRRSYRGEREGVEAARALIEESLAIYDRLPALDGKVVHWTGSRTCSCATGRSTRRRSRGERRSGLAAGARRSGAAAGLLDARGMAHRARRRPRRRPLLRPVRRPRAGVGKDPLGDVRPLPSSPRTCCCSAAGCADDVTSAAHPRASPFTEHGIDNYQVLLIRYNTAYALIRAGRICEAEALLRTPPEGSPSTSTAGRCTPSGP